MLSRHVSALQRGMWTAQRIGWVVAALALSLAGLGVAGGTGVLNNRDEHQGTFAVHYQPIARLGVDTDLTLTISPAQAEAVQVEVDSAFTAVFEVERIAPDPDRTQLTRSAGTRFVFAADSGGLVTVRIAGRFRRIGRYGISLSTGNDRVSLRGIVLP